MIRYCSQSGFQMTMSKYQYQSDMTTPTNHNKSKQRDEPIRIPSYYLLLAQSSTFPHNSLSATKTPTPKTNGERVGTFCKGYRKEKWPLEGSTSKRNTKTSSIRIMTSFVFVKCKTTKDMLCSRNDKSLKNGVNGQF